MSGLSRRLRANVLNKAIAFGLCRPLRNDQKGLADFAVSGGQIEEFLVCVGQGQLGDAEPTIGVAHANGDLFVADEDVLPGLGPLI